MHGDLVSAEYGARACARPAPIAWDAEDLWRWHRDRWQRWLLGRPGAPDASVDELFEGSAPMRSREDLAALLRMLELKTEPPASVALLNTWIATPRSSVGPGQAV